MLRTSISIPHHENIESVLLTLGGFSKFQFWASYAILSPEIPAAMIAMLPVFVGADPHGSAHLRQSNSNRTDFEDIIPSSYWETRNVMDEWELRGKLAWMTEFFTSVFMAGMMVGAFVSSQLADRFGRRKAHFTLIMTMSLFGISSAFSPTPWVYATLRFFAGIGVGGFYCIYSIYLMEFLTPRWRVICGSISFWFAGEMLLALSAYFISSWRILTLIASIPALFGLLTFPLMPETPRWLLCHSRTAEAHKVFGQIARFNGNKEPSLAAVHTLQQTVLQEEANQAKEFSGSDTKKPSNSLIALWSSSGGKLRMKLIIFIVLFFSLAFTYYGISFNAKNLSGDPFMNVFYMGLVDMFAFPAGSVFSNPLGRRRVTSLFLTFASVILFVLIGMELSVPDLAGLDGWVTLLCFLARFGVAGAWGVVVCFCQESFPTVVRSTALGICCLMANTGGVLAPQVAFIGTVWPVLPHLIFTGIVIVSAGLSWLLPEMSGKPLENF